MILCKSNSANEIGDRRNHNGRVNEVVGNRFVDKSRNPPDSQQHLEAGSNPHQGKAKVSVILKHERPEEHHANADHGKHLASYGVVPLLHNLLSVEVRAQQIENTEEAEDDCGGDSNRMGYTDCSPSLAGQLVYVRKSHKGHRQPKNIDASVLNHVSVLNFVLGFKSVLADQIDGSFFLLARQSDVNSQHLGHFRLNMEEVPCPILVRVQVEVGKVHRCRNESIPNSFFEHPAAQTKVPNALKSGGQNEKPDDDGSPESLSSQQQRGR